MKDYAKEHGAFILALDAGTQSIRAALVDLTGHIHHLVKAPIGPCFSERPGWAEQQPEYYWQMLCENFRKLFDTADYPKDSVVAVTLATQRGDYSTTCAPVNCHVVGLSVVGP
jgi:sugar (pentulose or hexulose) kinase